MNFLSILLIIIIVIITIVVMWKLFIKKDIKCYSGLCDGNCKECSKNKKNKK